MTEIEIHQKHGERERGGGRSRRRPVVQFVAKLIFEHVKLESTGFISYHGNTRKDERISFLLQQEREREREIERREIRRHVEEEG